MELKATGANGIDTVASTNVTVLATDPPCPVGSDDFDGNALDPKWELLRPVPTTQRVSGGALRITGLGGDMHGGTASVRNLALQPTPSGPWTATTRINVTALTPGGGQTGLLVWQSESPNNFAKVVYNRRSGNSYWFERQNNTNGVPAGGANAETTGSPTHIYLRVSSDGAANPTITAESSLDGATWTAVQTPFQPGGTGPIKVGLAYFQGNTTRVVSFDWFSLRAGETCGPDVRPPTTTAGLSPSSPGPGGTYNGPVGVALDATDNVDGSGVESTEYRIDGGAFQPYTAPFTVTAPGAHIVEFRSTDQADNVETTKSVSFSIAQCAGPASPEAGFERIWNGLDASGGARPDPAPSRSSTTAPRAAGS